MTLRKVVLVERKTRHVRLGGEDLKFLLCHGRGVIDVTPSPHRGVFRLRPRGLIGWIDGPNTRFCIRPKTPWPTLQLLFALNGTAAASSALLDPDVQLAEVFAREFLARFDDFSRQGLVYDYREQDLTAPFLRGKLRTHDQVRNAAAQAFPDRFFITDSVFTLDTPWNRIVLASANDLHRVPGLLPSLRVRLESVLQTMEGVQHIAPTELDFRTSFSEQRVTHYRPLLELCQRLEMAQVPASLTDSGGGGFLLDLSRAFEFYLYERLREQCESQEGLSIERHSQFRVGPLVMEPDLVLRRDGMPIAVLDAKWKKLGTAPGAGDLHQVISYGTVVGVEHVGLVYPGRRFIHDRIAIPGSTLHVHLVEVRVVGSHADCAASVDRLSRRLRRLGAPAPRSGDG